MLKDILDGNSVLVTTTGCIYFSTYVSLELQQKHFQKFHISYFLKRRLSLASQAPILFSLRKTIFFCITRKKIKIKRDISAKWYTVTTDTIDMLFKQTKCPLLCYISTRFCLHGKFDSLHFQHQGCKSRGVKKGKMSTQLISVVMLEF